jgi:hypothetical protein
MRCLHLTLALSLLWAVPCLAQAPAPIPEAALHWSFDVDTEGWQSTDPKGSVTVTQDAAICRANGGGALQLAYTPGEAQFTAVMTPTEAGLGNGKSLHFWVRTSDYAVMLLFAGERDDSHYAVGFTSLPNTWQEVSLGLDDLQLGDDSQDENDRLDPDQITGVALADATGMLVKLAEAMPFIQAPDLGPRKLWLDDFSVTSTPTDPRWQETPLGGKPAILLDSFERSPLQWLMLCGKGADVTYDKEHKTAGDYSLRLQYALPEGKVFGAITPLGGVPLKGAQVLRLAAMSENPMTLFIELKEADDSKYQATAPLEAGGQLKTVELPLIGFKLADDSKDENGQLDADQLKELTLADLSVLTGAATAKNTLWLDEVGFLK